MSCVKSAVCYECVMKCDASNNEINVVNSLKIIYPLACSECTPIYSSRARICKRLRSPGIDSEESIPLANVAWRTGTTNRVVVPTRQAGNRFMGSLKGLQIRALVPASLLVWLSISIVCVFRRSYYHLLTCMPCMHAYPVAAKREFTFVQEEENKTTACRQAKIISR
jgi:hypothetical protein